MATYADSFFYGRFFTSAGGKIGVFGRSCRRETEPAVGYEQG